ncbi:GTPase [Flagellimonas sp. S3867]|uniref:GTPase n=1 Tax=Flagellimonas sp. S3867 TaxID=2768063 RepID=UPI0016861CF1|nr:GTPase [Flagellimonas sp. S3867]
MKREKTAKLLFVYNANSGIRNTILDSMHKVFSPSTYECNLCDITFGIVSENKTWKKFRQESQYKMVFLHKDEFARAYGSKLVNKFTLPIVLSDSEKGLKIFISTEELNQLKTAQDLVESIEKQT